MGEDLDEYFLAELAEHEKLVAGSQADEPTAKLTEEELRKGRQGQVVAEVPITNPDNTGQIEDGDSRMAELPPAIKTYMQQNGLSYDEMMNPGKNAKESISQRNDRVLLAQKHDFLNQNGINKKNGNKKNGFNSSRDDNDRLTEAETIVTPGVKWVQEMGELPQALEETGTTIFQNGQPNPKGEKILERIKNREERKQEDGIIRLPESPVPVKSFWGEAHGKFSGWLEKRSLTKKAFFLNDQKRADLKEGADFFNRHTTIAKLREWEQDREKLESRVEDSGQKRGVGGWLAREIASYRKAKITELNKQEEGVYRLLEKGASLQGAGKIWNNIKLSYKNGLVGKVTDTTIAGSTVAGIAIAGVAGGAAVIPVGLAGLSLWTLRRKGPAIIRRLGEAHKRTLEDMEDGGQKVAAHDWRKKYISKTHYLTMALAAGQLGRTAVDHWDDVVNVAGKIGREIKEIPQHIVNLPQNMQRLWHGFAAGVQAPGGESELVNTDSQPPVEPETSSAMEESYTTTDNLPEAHDPTETPVVDSQENKDFIPDSFESGLEVGNNGDFIHTIGDGDRSATHAILRHYATENNFSDTEMKRFVYRVANADYGEKLDPGLKEIAPRQYNTSLENVEFSLVRVLQKANENEEFGDINKVRKGATIHIPEAVLQKCSEIAKQIIAKRG